MEEGISIFRKALHMSRASSSSPQDARKQVVLRVLGMLLVLALSFLVLWFQESLRRMAPYGYAGVFFLTLAANASVILPLPGLVLPFTMGAVLHPFWVAVAAAAGAALGELSGYILGFSGQAFVENYRIYQRLKALMRRYGPWAVLITAILPLPLFDFVGILAGATRWPLHRFLFWVFLGKLIKMLAITYFGGWLLPWMGLA